MDVTLGQIRAANKKQQPYFKGSADWRLSDWVVALAGEVGEAANIVKKINRGDFTLEAKRKDLADELADILIYLDDVAAAAGIDMAEAVTRKFNVVSERVSSPVRLRPLPPCVAALVAERAKQESKGFDAAHDKTHARGELVNAAAYAIQRAGRYPVSSPWPFNETPTVLDKAPERQLEIALGFLGAEYDRRRQDGAKDACVPDPVKQPEMQLPQPASAEQLELMMPRPAVAVAPVGDKSPMKSPSTWYMVKHTPSNGFVRGAPCQDAEYMELLQTVNRACAMADVIDSPNLGSMSTAQAVGVFGDAVAKAWSEGGIKTRAHIIKTMGISRPARVWVDLDAYPSWYEPVLARVIETHTRVRWLLTTTVPARLPARSGALLSAIAKSAWLGTVFSNQEEADERVPNLFALSSRQRFVVYVPNAEVDIRNKCAWKLGGMGAKGVVGFLPDNAEADDWVFHVKSDAIAWAVVDAKFPGLAGNATDAAKARNFIQDCFQTGVSCYVDYADAPPSVELPK